MPALYVTKNAGESLNVMQGVARTRSAYEVGEIMHTGNEPSVHLPQLLDVAHGVVVMMFSIHVLKERMVPIAGALSNTADVSGARNFLTDFARDVGRMYACLACTAVQPAPVEQVVPVATDNMLAVVYTTEVATDIPAPTVAAQALPLLLLHLAWLVLMLLSLLPLPCALLLLLLCLTFCLCICPHLVPLA